MSYVRPGVTIFLYTFLFGLNFYLFAGNDWSKQKSREKNNKHWFLLFCFKKEKKTRHLCLFCASMGEKISTIAIRLSCMFVFWLSRILIRMNKKGFFMHALHWEKKSTNYNLSQSQKTAFVASTQEILDFPYWLPR